MKIDLINCIRFENRDAFVLPRLQRSWELLMLVEKGSCEVTCGEDRKTFLLQEGEIALLPGNAEIRRKVISTLTFYQFAFYAPTAHPFYRAALSGKMKLPREQVVAILQSVRNAYPLSGNCELIEQIVEYTFAQNSLFGKSNKQDFLVLSEAVNDTVQYLNRHLSERIDMGDLAARVYLSHSALIWKFKQELKMTPSQYLIHLRLRYAKHLLLTTSNSIAEISAACGYSNPYYFTNAFHRYAGKSPTDFRAYYLKEKK